MQIEAGINPLTVKLGSLSLTFEPEVKKSRPTMVLFSLVSLTHHPILNQERLLAGVQCAVDTDHLTVYHLFDAGCPSYMPSYKASIYVDRGGWFKSYFCLLLIANNFLEEALWIFFFLFCCRIMGL